MIFNLQGIILGLIITYCAKICGWSIFIILHKERDNRTRNGVMALSQLLFFFCAPISCFLFLTWRLHSHNLQLCLFGLHCFWQCWTTEALQKWNILLKELSTPPLSPQKDSHLQPIAQFITKEWNTHSTFKTWKDVDLFPCHSHHRNFLWDENK